MKNYFIYEGSADNFLLISGYSKRRKAKIEGCKLMFASKKYGGFIEPIAFEDETTKDNVLYGAVWELDDEMYDFFDEEYYSGSTKVTKEVILEDGEKILCDLHTMREGVFAVPDNFGTKAMEAFYEKYGFDKGEIERAKEEAENEIYGVKSVS